MRKILRLWLSLMAMLASHMAFAAQSPAEDTGKVVASLVSTHDQVAPGDTFHVALKTVLDDHWHTYWRNPGDSGEPVQIAWSLPEGVTVGRIIWPLPAPIATGPIINYGFEGTPYFPVEFTAPQDAKVGDILDITAQAYYLVCYDVCIPEQAELKISLTVGESQTDTLNKAGIDNAILDAPKRQDARGGLELSGQNLSLTLNGLPDNVDLTESYFFPYEQGYFQHSQPQKVSVGAEGIHISTLADYLWEEDTPDMIEGVIRYKRNGEFTGEIVSLNVGQAVPIGTIAGVNGSIGAEGAGASGTGLSLWAALIGALIGGLILNIMPCVFPVISMKALSVAKAGHGETAIIRREAWTYTLGVMVTFIALIIALLSLKSFGVQIGWGFQLQSPVLVGLLALLLFAIGLNLLGVFEIGASLQNVGNDITRKDGTRGAFFTGVLAVIVATPCTAPFMAGAMGYALAQPAMITVIVFMALAIGFALPFLLIAYSPSILRLLPKPGPWMVRFKELLSFPMFGAAIWLVWVTSQQVGDSGLVIVLIAMLLFGLSVWLFKSPKMFVKLISSAALIGSIVLPLSLRASTPQVTNIKANTTSWSSAKVDAALDDGKIVFVDFTAAWCVTCKANEKLVLSRSKVQSRLADEDVVFMVADWTNKNDEIAQELARHGRSGIPLYLVYRPDDNAVSPQVLPQTLTQNIVLSALSKS